MLIKYKYMINFEFTDDGRIKLNEPPKSLKKITGSRLAPILGIGTSALYNTPFSIWCALVKLYEKPFEDNQYTLAGKEIEPKLAKYFSDLYNLDTLYSPDQYLGKGASKMWDFYPDNKVFGGKWDYVFTKPKGEELHPYENLYAKPDFLNPFDEDLNRQIKEPIYKIIECKTAQIKKKDFWISDRVPDDYYVQLGLYCYLENIEDALFLVAFLEPDDYNDPKKFVLTKDNTLARKQHYSLENFKRDYIDYAYDWYNKYCIAGVSPKFNLDNKIDKEIIDTLKKQKEAEKELENSVFSYKKENPFY